MTEQTTDETTIPEAVEPADEPTDLPEGDANGAQGLVEARDRYRGERDSAREELAAAQARIAGYQRAEVERLAAGSLSHSSDIFSLTDNSPEDYLTDDGHIDAEKVQADVAAILAERPGLARRVIPSDPTQGSGGNITVKREPTMADLLRR